MQKLGSIFVILLAVIAAPAAAAPWAPERQRFADTAFERQWSRTDDARVRDRRGWFWGPGAWFDYYEFNRQSPNGLRLVQYFDKARMEINDPASGTVTNGLLVVELVTGFQRLGDAPDDSFARSPAYVPVAGDPADVNPDAPTYASFAGVTTTPNAPRRGADQRGQPIGTMIDRVGQLSAQPDLAAAYADQTRGATYIEPTGHTVPAVFWRFLNQRGLILEADRPRTGLVIDWVAVMGYPISDAYWVRTKVGGQSREVLVQLFERRILTFTPSNPPSDQVEMGNVGQHYFAWRYDMLGQPWAADPPPLPIFYASDVGGGRFETFRMSPDGDNQAQYIASGNGETLPYSVRPAFGGYEDVQVLFDSRRSDGTYRQLYAAPFVNGSDVIRLTYTDTTPPFDYSPYQPVDRPSHAYNPASSPDGSKIAFVSDRSGKPQIYLIGYQGIPIGTVGDVAQLTTGDCVHQAPAWSPDGRTLAWMEDCDGDFELVLGDLVYEEDSRSFVGRYTRNNLRASLANIRKLTDNMVEDGFPRWSPDGSRIAFHSRRAGGIAHLFTSDPAGGQVRQLTSGSADDVTPVWSPDGARMAFASLRDGNWEIYRLDSGGQVARLTNNPADDRWPVWAP